MSAGTVYIYHARMFLCSAGFNSRREPKEKLSKTTHKNAEQKKGAGHNTTPSAPLSCGSARCVGESMTPGEGDQRLGNYSNLDSVRAYLVSQKFRMYSVWDGLLSCNI